MLNVIFAIKFVHMIAMAVMLGTWICIALLTLFAYRSGNTSVVALTSLFTVRAEFALMAPAVALQPLAGFPLAVAIGAHLDEYWIELSLAIYMAVVVAWLASLIVELRVRNLARQAALNSKPLPASYRRLFVFWSATTLLGLGGTIAIMSLMIWQPHWH
ncbi:MAG: DUF2269 domain-containing protein [Xanthobacteraceae bacterium]